MKTNQIMKVNFGNNVLSIGHKDLMGNVNELINIGNDYRIKVGLEPMRMDKILEKKGIQEYIVMLAKKTPSPKKGYVIINDLQEAKKLKTVIRTKTGINAGTWAHLNIMIRIAIEMNPEFADEVITTFVKGKLLDYRDVAGDDFKILSKAIEIFEPSVRQRMQMAKGLNYIVFGIHYTAMRDTANTQQMKELIDLQKTLAFAVDMGYIKSFDELINEMRRIYHKNKNK